MNGTQSPRIEQKVGAKQPGTSSSSPNEPFLKEFKQEGARAASALVADKQKIGARTVQPAGHPSAVLPEPEPAQVPVANVQCVVTQEQAERRQLVQSQGK